MLQVTREAKDIAKSLNLDDRIEGHSEKSAFITLKDHKDGFQNNPKCKLINPAKSEIGKVSKKILDSINSQVREKTDLIQWRNTSEAIDLFKQSDNKNKKCFLKFDIVEFYPSITKDLLLNALKFAKTYSAIPDESENILLHCRKSFLFHNKDVWTKQKDSDFDVTMGSFDGGEICELVGLYLLNLLKKEFGSASIGLYRDDGLACCEKTSGPQIERIKKSIVNIFKSNGLKITIEANLHQTDFLDVTMDLVQNQYFPYRKPNSDLLYIDHKSNHPPNILKQLPQMIESRLSRLSIAIMPNLQMLSTFTRMSCRKVALVNLFPFFSQPSLLNEYETDPGI